jgi:hypothetical protein
MVHDSVWKLAGMGPDMLCIGCLEARLGRKLEPHSFTDVLCNGPPLSVAHRQTAQSADGSPPIDSNQKA